MPAPDRWRLVPFEPTPDQVIRIGWISAALGFLIAIVSAVGELLGWWDLLGEVGMTVGSLLGIVATFTTLAFTAGRDQMAGIQTTVESVHETIGNVDRRMGSVDTRTARNTEILQDNNEKLGEATGTLDGIEDALVQADGETSTLDVVQAELDRQTGVLDRQVEVLEAIHGRL